MDIGCGSGRILYLAREDGWQVRGMELHEKAAADIKEDQGIDVIVDNFLEYDNPEGEAYDVVVVATDFGDDEVAVFLDGVGAGFVHDVDFGHVVVDYLRC